MFSLPALLNHILPRAESAPLAETFSIPTTLIVVASICVVLTTFAIGVRAFTKSLDWRRVQWDDLAIILAEAGLVTFIAVLFESTLSGEGVSASKLSASSAERVHVFANSLSIVYAPTILAAKVAVLIQTARFFAAVQQRAMYWSVLALIAVTSIAHTLLFLFRVIACKLRTCAPTNTDAVSTAFVSATTNVAILLVITCVAAKMRLNFTKKILVAHMLCLGLFACACSAMELIRALKVVKSSDFSKAIFSMDLWALAEIACIIIIACCPTLPWSFRIEDDQETHKKWVSNASTRTNTPIPDMEQAIPQTPATPCRCSIIPEEVLVRGSLQSVASAPTKLQTIPSERPISTFETKEMNVSHHSYEVRRTGTVREAMSRKASQRTLASLTSLASPTTPISPTPTHMSVGQVCDACEVRIEPVKVKLCKLRKTVLVKPVSVGKIRRTIQVRLSSHTNPGSPIRWGRPDERW